MRSKLLAAVAFAAAISCPASAQTSGGAGGSTAGSSNAAVSGQSVGARSAPTQPGIAPGSSNPAGVNGSLGDTGMPRSTTGIAPQSPGTNSLGTAASVGNPGTAGTNNNHTVGNAGVTVTGPNTPGSPDMIERENRELDKKLNNICRGC